MVFREFFKLSALAAWVGGIYGVACPILISNPNTISVVAGFTLMAVGAVPGLAYARQIYLRVHAKQLKSQLDAETDHLIEEEIRRDRILSAKKEGSTK